jgi:YidC/Oxa1 family membrane protein insertase
VEGRFLVGNQRNMITAIMLSVLVLLGWTFVSERYFPQPKPVAGAQKPGAPVITPAAAAAAARVDVAAALTGPARLTVTTPRLKGSINLKGAVIDDLVLLDYNETTKKSSPPVRLLSPANAKTSYFAGFGWSGEALAAPNGETIWQADGIALTPETPVTLSWANATGQTFKIMLSVDKNYMFSVQQTVLNAGTGAVAVKPYSYVSRFGPSKDPSTWTNHIGPLGTFNAKMNYDVNWDDIDEAGPAGQRFPSKGGWIGFSDHYWLTALIPDQAASIDAGFRTGNGSYQAEFTVPQAMIAPGATSTTTTRFFAGAKEVGVLEGYQSAGVPLFGKAIDWGWFEIIAKPFFYLLEWLFHLVGNFGFAIIMLTFIVRGAMFPIAQRQFASMAAMRIVQPKMKAIQEKWKDDKQRQQQEIMELYKAEKINPLAGCLPILLQIPVFYALYKVLTLTIEMRHQPFVLWIKDLSAPDSAHILNLFGMLPFTPPVGFLSIGVLAVLLGVTMYLQFKLNPAPMDPMQQQMFAIMPWVMMFVMAPFAAGLQLYWVVSNLLTIAQQKFLYSRHPEMKAPAPVVAK